MKSFKKYISEEKWASSYETNYIIKKALKKYNNPIEFLLNLMHLAKKLPIMGKKNTLELVKVWNDNKSKKINAALVEQVLSEERKLNLKGWMHLSGKSVLSNIRSGYKPYHMQMLTRNPREFGVKEKDLKKVLRDEYDHPDLKALDKHWDELVEGIYDKEDVLAAYMHKKGWAEVVFEDGNNSIEMGDNPKPRDIQKIAYEIDKTYSDSQLFPESSAYFEVKLKGKRVDIDNILDFRSFIKTGKVPTRSEIGRTMAQFREEQESIEEAEYQGKKVTLNKPFRTPGKPKKFAVYTKNDKDKVVIVRFGDPNMEIKRDDPKRLKAYRARMSCDDNPGPKWKANYWSCYQWRAGAKVDD